MKKKKSVKRIVLSIMILMFAWFTIHIVVITVDGLKDELRQVDVAVVLGNKVEENGAPSDRLRSRLDRTIELYQADYFNFIVVSGGIGKEGFDEAVAMKDYLVKYGIDEANIIVDNKGNNTMLTALNTKEIITEQNLSSVMVITQFYHVSRCKLAFDRAGVKEVYSAHSNYSETRDLYSLVREFFGYYKYRFMRIN